MHSIVMSIVLICLLNFVSWVTVADLKSNIKQDKFIEENELSESRLFELEDEEFLAKSSHHQSQFAVPETRQKRTAVMEDENLWPNATIPYIVADVIEKDPISYDVIMESIDHWHEKTCIRFIKYNNTLEVRKRLEASGRYVEFISGNGCHSSVGRRSDRGSQNVSIALACAFREMIIHELGHLVGLWHEHARYDRDNHVIVLFNNIEESVQHNFDKQKSMRLLAPYDLSSIMHYSLKTFSGNDENVMKPIMEDLEFLVGYRADLSFYDGQTVNALYKCSGHCAKSAPKCVNGGYQNKDCKCVCPSRLTGPTCKQVATNKGCGGVLEIGRKKISIRSPGYPENYPGSAECTWLLKSSNSSIVLYVEDFELERSSGGTCVDYLEVRYHYIGIERGPVICGNLTHLKKRTFTSTTSQMIIRFRSSSANSGRGFHLVANSVPKSNCASNPCHNGAKCHEALETETYICDCTSGWLGHNCDIEVVDGQWSEWSAWSGCQAECGHEHRGRRCKSPVNGGRECSGPTGESRRCNQLASRCNGYFYCDFGTQSTGTDECGMRQENTTDRLDWIAQTGTTLTRNTGPRTGHSSGDRGDVYFYIEASHGRPFDNAILWLPSNGWSIGRYCLQFHYHMYGQAMGELRVLRKTKKTSAYIWQESSCHGNLWNQANINVILYDGITIGFEGIRGDSFESDIALDDISISPGGCAEQMVNDQPSSPLIPAQLPYGKRSRSSRRRTVNACFHKNRHYRFGQFSYFDKCKRINCFCNQNGKVDCPSWKMEDLCSTIRAKD